MKIGDKLYRVTVVLLSIILIITALPTAKRYYNFKQQRINNYETVIVNTNDNGNVEVINTIDDTTLRVKYVKDEDKYTLYRDDVEYNLETTIYGNDLVVDLAQANPQSYDGVVIGQFAMAIPLILWTPALIQAAQITICAAVAVVGTYTVWYSVDSIAQTIDANKSKTIAQTKTDTKRETGYFAAALMGGTVAISNQITYAEAVARLTAGMDVFATSKSAASAAALAATVPGKKPVFHTAHGTGEGFYPHYHPGGRSWIMNKNHMPHCWFAAP